MLLIMMGLTACMPHDAMCMGQKIDKLCFCMAGQFFYVLVVPQGLSATAVFRSFRAEDWFFRRQLHIA